MRIYYREDIEMKKVSQNIQGYHESKLVVQDGFLGVKIDTIGEEIWPIYLYVHPKIIASTPVEYC